MSYYVYIIYTSLTYDNFYIFFFIDTATTEIYTLSLHDALPIDRLRPMRVKPGLDRALNVTRHAKPGRSEEHTSELQSRVDLVCRLLLEKKKRTHKFKEPEHKLLRS